MTNLELIKSAPYAVLPKSASTGEPMLKEMPILFNTTVEATQWIHINLKHPFHYVVIDTTKV